MLRHYFKEKFSHSLTGKLIITIGSSFVLISLILSFFLIRYQKNELFKNALSNGLFFAEYVRKSTRYGMLIFHSEIIQKTIEGVASAEGVINVRIYDNKCRIRYSSVPEEIGITKDKASAVCSGCHFSSVPSEGLRATTRWNIITDAKGGRVLNIIQPIYNEYACYTADCHVHNKNEKTLGMIESNRSLERLDATIKGQEKAIAVYVLSFVLLTSIAICATFLRFVSRPVALLIEGMERAGRGNLDTPVRLTSTDEMQHLADAFNAMISDIKDAKQYLASMETEKLAVLGRMAAGVAHEINNPLTGIVVFSHLMLKRTQPESDDHEDLKMIIEQADRCKDIIKGLLDFARSSPVVSAPVNINEVLKHSLHLIESKADFQDIKFIVHTDEALGHIMGDPSKLQQVFLNLLVNAADAMEGRGTLTISTRTVPGNVGTLAEVEFTDTGSGIPEEDIPKIFEPFFTTKPVGKGTGLGLSVSYGIVEDHGGKIIVKSFPGEGASFFVRLPISGGGVGQT